MSSVMGFAGSSLSGSVLSSEDLPNQLLHSSYDCNETLPLEAACATETAARTTAPLLSWEAYILCQALNIIWGRGDESYCSENESAAT